MDKTEIQKIQRFLSDKIMSGAVYEVLLDSFLKERANADVYVLAASRLSVDYLKQGWKELEKLKSAEEEVERDSVNPGL